PAGGAGAGRGPGADGPAGQLLQQHGPGPVRPLLPPARPEPGDARPRLVREGPPGGGDPPGDQRGLQERHRPADRRGPAPGRA
ncbi:unnamed protein product, partial [Heterosigma akashiwo]